MFLKVHCFLTKYWRDVHMIVQADFIKKLKDFGLNSYEAKIWTALLSRGVSTAGELSDIAGVPRSRSYDVLESLEKKGFIVMKVGKPIKYIAIQPSEIIGRVKKKIEEDYQEKQSVFDELKESEVLKELTLLHNQGVDMIDPTELTGAIKGRDQLYGHLDFMIKNAEKNILLVTTEEGLVQKEEVLKKALKKAKDRGVNIRIAAPLSKKTTQTVKSLKEVADIRHFDDIKTRFCAVDESNLFFMLMDSEKVHQSYDVGIWVNTPFFTQTLTHFFNTNWKNLKKSF